MKYTLEEQKQHRADWVADLRSGQYSQGRGCLVKAGADGMLFCCLGVAYMTMGRTIEDTPDSTKAFVDTPAFVQSEKHVFYLPGLDMVEYFGLRPGNTNGFFDLPEFRGGSLTDMNDGGLTFAQIADMIEYEPKGLFVEEKTE